MVLSLDLEVMWDPLGSNGPYIPDMPSELQEHWQAQPLWPPCYCNRRTLVQAISIIHTYYKYHDHSRGIEQNRGRPGRCSVSAKYILFANITFTLPDPFNISLTAFQVPPEGILAMVYLLGEKDICHHTPTWVITSTNRHLANAMI